ncbi:HAD family hydrolase [Cobetia marina]|uniref:HAD family hydrolase n=1 Tax=Cobetia marina TaxID=28258 RepID=UPI001141DFAC|nr:hypothetical protein [Cobetia marina]GED41022.1 hypothetical protein HHA02_03510 [Cobetia marina]
MNVLYFLEPVVELQNPIFRYGAFKNFVNKHSFNIKTESPSYNIYCVVSSAVLKYAQANFLNLDHLNIIAIDEAEWLSEYTGYYDLSRDAYQDTLKNGVLAKWKSILARSVDVESIDIVLSWESPSAAHLDKVFTNAIHRYCMPGVMSRAPFAELTFIDPFGLFNKSSLSKFKESLLSYKATDEELNILKYLKKDFCQEYFKPYCPVDVEKIKIEQEFDYVILLPLQISGYYAFDHVSGFRSQLDFLEYVLKSVPENIGVLVTQYVTSNISDRAINDKTNNYLKSKYKNLIHFDELDHVDGISQYLSTVVDGVICASSSIGIIASIWGKPLISIGESHLSVYSDGNSIDDLEVILRKSKSGLLNNKDDILAWMFTRICHFTVNDVYNSNNSFDFLEECLVNKKVFKDIEDYPIVNTPESFINNFKESSKFDLAMTKLKGTVTDSNIKEKIKGLELALNKINDPDVVVVSFDIFDTLLQRPFEKPVDLFELMREDVLEISEGMLTNFKEIRTKAEGNVKKALVSADKEEIHLVEIYNEIRSLTCLSDSILYKVMQLEIEMEIKYLEVRPSGKQLYDYAISLGKKVIIASDMYLDKEVIKKLLTKNGFGDYCKLYLSSDILLKKHTGSLYDHILRDLDLSAGSIVHIGDNKHGDIKMAAGKGIATIYLPRAMETFYSVTPYKNLYHKTLHSKPLPESLMIGLIANKLYEPAFNKVLKDSHFNQGAFNLGYAGLGPLFFSFTKWIIEEAINDNISDLYFLSRDGDIIKKAYEVISLHYKNPPKAHYLLSSRRSARVATLYNRQDIISLASTAIYNTKLSEVFENKLGVTLSQDDITLVQSVGFASLDSKVSARNDKSKFVELAVKLENKILQNSQCEREAYLEYIDSSGLSMVSRPAVVDIGYAASMQKSISRLIDRKVTGYYFTSFTSAREVHNSGMPVKSFNGNFIDPKASSNPIANLGLAFETVFSNDQGSFVCMQKNKNNELSPKLEPIAHESEKIKLVRILHSAVVEFASDFTYTYEDCFKSLVFDADRAIKIYVSYLTTPSGRDAEIFEGVTFDDAFSGAGTRYMVPPRSWAPLTDEKLACCVWKQGSSVFLRRPDINNKKSIKNVSPQIAIQEEKVKESSKYKNDLSHNIVAPSQRRVIENILRPAIKRFWTKKQYNKFLRDHNSFYKDSKYLSWLAKKA